MSRFANDAESSSNAAYVAFAAASYASNIAHTNSNVIYNTLSSDTGNMNVASNLNVASNITVSGITSLSNNTYIAAPITVLGPTTLASNLDVSGTTVLNDAFVGGPLTVYGHTTLSNVVTLSSNLAVAGGATFGGAVTVASNLEVLGSINATRLNYQYSNVTVYTSETIQSNLLVQGATVLSNTALVYGRATLSNGATVAGDLLVAGPAAFASNVTVSGNLNFIGSLLSNGQPFSGGTGTGSATTVTNLVTVLGSNSTSNGLVPGADISYDLGTETMRWRNLYLGGSTISFGTGVTITPQNWIYLQNYVIPPAVSPLASTAMNSNQVFVGAAQLHSALVQNGQVYAFGDNTFGQLGMGDTSNVYTTPTLVPGISNAAAVACGRGFTLVLTSTSNVLGMGLNAYGQLGQPLASNFLTSPTAVPGLSNVATLSAGQDFSVFLTAAGLVLGLGDNGVGQLGTGVKSATNTTLVAMQLPTASNGSSADVVAGYAPSAVSCGNEHTCLLLKNGAAYLCGNNTSNQLGTTQTVASNTAWPILLSNVQQVTKVACGAYHTVAACYNGDVYTFGANDTAQMGMGNTSNYSLPQRAIVGSNTVSSSNGIGGYYQLGAGQGHTVVATCFAPSNYPTYVWGDNTSGQLGMGSNVAYTTPTKLVGYQAVQVGCGQDHTVLLLADTNAFVGFGANSDGQMGDAQMVTNRYFPNVITPTGTVYQKQLFTGGAGQAQHVAYVDADGTLYCGGCNDVGQLGLEYKGTPSNANFYSGVPLSPLSTFDQRVTQVALGYNNTAAIDVNGKLWTWGYSGHNLGLGNMVNTSTPIMVNGTPNSSITGSTVVTHFAGGANNALAIDSTGVAHGCGNISYIGNNGGSSSIFVSLSGVAGSSLSYVSCVGGACGYLHTLVVDSTGHVHAWGDATYGQCGNGAINGGSIALPFKLTTLPAITAVAAGYTHSVALDTMGKVYTWGYAPNGQLGTNIVSSTGTPVSPSSFGSLVGKPAVAIAAGMYHTLALDSSGHVHAWGYNANGQLGNGSTTQTNIPIAVSTYGTLNGSTVVAIAATADTSYALDTLGRIHVWGLNLYGQYGDGGGAASTWSKVPILLTGSQRTSAAAQRILSRGYGNHKLLQDVQQQGTTYLQAAGSNAYGQLGDGTTLTRYAGAFASGYAFPSPVVATANGLYHSAAVLANGGVYCWGRNSAFECGQGATTNVGVPSLVGSLSAYSAVEVACGTGVTLVVTTNGTVVAFGTNLTGLLGNGSALGTNTSVSGAVVVTGLTNVQTLVAGEGHACAIDASGALWAWGDNSKGQFGLGAAGVTSSALVPVLVPSAALGGYRAVEVSCGVSHTAVLTSAPALMTAGLNSLGQLGTATNAGTTTANPVFVAVAFPASLSGAVCATYPASVACGPNHTVALLANGTIRTFGANDWGQLGLPTGSAGWSATPIKPTGLRNRYVTNVNASAATTYVEAVLPRELTSLNAAGTTTISVYAKVRSYGRYEMASGEDVVATGADSATTIIATKAGAVHAWGSNNTGQFGNGNGASTSSPIPVAISSFGSLSTISAIVAVAVGVSHTIAVDSVGKVHAWGSGLEGQLGKGTTVGSMTPAIVSTYGSLASGVTVAAVACGAAHTVALDTTGKVHAWGNNNYGQLGNGTTTAAYVPTAITYGSIATLTIASIVAANTTTIALDTTGKVHIWGSFYGSGSVVPIQVASGSIATLTITAVACGGQHMVALDTTGGVHAWGSNNLCQLGNSTTTSTALPIAISFGSLVTALIVAIACGSMHTVALDMSGKVHAWGQNTSYQLGNNSNLTSTVPIAVSTFGTLATATVVAIACGSNHTLALDSTGKLHAWGSNISGQRGNAGGLSNVPVLITGNFGSLASATAGSIFWNFTGQHRCFVDSYASSARLRQIEGLAVCSDKNRYITTSSKLGGDAAFVTGARAITTNDALPVLSLASKARDKTVFGVVSLATNYDPAPDPTPAQISRSLERGDCRAEINAVGEGGMWVCDLNGPLQAGDYVTTAGGAMPGYGMRQDEPYLCNFTVAKVTMDCDFSAPLVPQLGLRMDDMGNNALDADGQVIWDPVLDADGVTVCLEGAYRTRHFLATPDGVAEVTPEEYVAAEAAAVAASGTAFTGYRAAFVGCTYHCG
jgi:alpha-tubulin suppressor-like RCC1 family protein